MVQYNEFGKWGKPVVDKYLQEERDSILGCDRNCELHYYENVILFGCWGQMEIDLEEGKRLCR